MLTHIKWMCGCSKKEMNMQEAKQVRETQEQSETRTPEELFKQIEHAIHFAEKSVSNHFGMTVEGFRSFSEKRIEEQLPKSGEIPFRKKFARTPHYTPLSANPFVAMSTIANEENDSNTVRVLSQVKPGANLGSCVKLMPETSVSEFREMTPASIFADFIDERSIPLDLGEIASLHLNPNNLRKLNKVFRNPVLVLGNKHTDNPEMSLFIESDTVTWVEAEQPIANCSVFFI